MAIELALDDAGEKLAKQIENALKSVRLNLDIPSSARLGGAWGQVEDAIWEYRKEVAQV